MILLPPRSTRTDTLYPYTTLFRSGGYSSQIYPVPAERRVRRVIEPERPHRRRHAWPGADDPRIVPSLRRCTQAVCLPPIAEQGCHHAVTISIEAREAPIESTAQIILERYVPFPTGNHATRKESSTERVWTY